MLMHFIHAAAIIKAGSGVKEVLAGTFGSTLASSKCLKFEQVAAGQRRCGLTTVHNHHVKTVIIMMKFSRGGHEGDWLFTSSQQKPCSLISALLASTTMHVMAPSTSIR